MFMNYIARWDITEICIYVQMFVIISYVVCLYIKYRTKSQILPGTKLKTGINFTQLPPHRDSLSGRKSV